MERSFGRQEARQPSGCHLVYSKNDAAPCDLRSAVRVSTWDSGQSGSEPLSLPQ